MVRGNILLVSMPGASKIAASMIAVAELADPPFRHGSNEDTMIRATLLRRLSTMDIHRDIAVNTDEDDYVAAVVP